MRKAHFTHTGCWQSLAGCRYCYVVENEALIDAQLVEDMDTVAKLHKLALSVREKAKIKIRQPLSRLLIAPDSDAEKHAVNRFPDLLKDGLNVKQV